MKRFVSILSWLILGAAAIISLLIVSGSWFAPHALSTIAGPAVNQLPSPATMTDNFPVGQPRRVDFDVDDPLLESLSPREQTDQALDWLLWTIAKERVPDAEQLSRMLFDVPTMRHGYLRQVARFEYGRSRSCMLESGDVLALVQKANADQRADDLAHIADAQRKDLGRIPGILQVFEYELNGIKSATLTRLESIPGESLFSPENGYFEATVTHASELTDFMAKTDDLVAAHVEPGGLRLGGRKTRNGYRNVSPTEVAAVWQAEADIQMKIQAQKKKIDEFNASWGLKFKAFDAMWRGRAATLSNRQAHDRESAQLARDHEIAMKAFELKLRAESKQLHLVNGSGFSLDPTYNYAGLAAALEKPRFIDWPERDSLNALLSKIDGQADSGEKPKRKLEEWTVAEVFKRVGMPPSRLTASIAALRKAESDVVPLLQLIDDLTLDESNRASRTFAKILSVVEQSFRFQAARYDGPLQGTEVGMILFYTDLVMKLWDFNYEQSTPTIHVPDFLAETRLAVSPVFMAERLKLPSTRMWFGPEDSGFQLISKDQLFFARNATRIYAASSNPLNPGKEVTADASSEIFLGWWNDHYEEVARYETEYQRLNEVMKWSLLVSWLSEAQRESLLAFLADMKVDRSSWFPEWAAKNPNLRYGHWKSVSFLPRGYLGIKTETLPILKSESFRPLGMGAESSGYSFSGGVSLASKDTFKARPALSTALPDNIRRSGLNYTKVSNADELVTMRGARFNFATRAKNLALDPVVGRTEAAIIHMAGPDGVKFRSPLGDLATGRFTRVVQRVGDVNTVRLETAGAEIGALNITRSKNGFRVGWRAREVDDGFALGRKLSTSPDPFAVLQSDASVQFAVRDPGTGEFYVQSVGSKRWLKLAPEKEPLPDLAEGWSARVADLKPEAKTYQLKWLEPTELPEQVRTGGQWARGPPPPPKGPGPAGTTASSADFPWNDRDAMAGIADDIASRPGAWKKEHNSHLAETLAYLDDLSRRQPRRAADQIREAIARHGERPELLLREAMAELDSANAEAAASVVNRVQVKSPKDINRLLSEIDARLPTATGQTRSDLHTCAEALEWKGSGKLVVGEEVRVVPDKDGLSLEVLLSNTPEGSRITNTADLRNAPIYYEDMPSLNNIDWSKSPQAAFDYVHSHDLGTVVQLPRSDIAHYRPRTITVAGQSRQYRAAGPVSAPIAAARAARTSFRGWNGGDDDEEEKKRKQEFIYVVTAKPAIIQATR